MKAVTLGASGVEISKIERPVPQPHQVLVKVRGCGLNRSDLLETQGQSFGHVSGDTKVLGGEFAGEIVELGSESQGLSVGERVMCRGGAGWAEYALAHWRRSIPIKSDNIAWEQAATLQGALQTMHDAIVTNGRFSAGQTVLIQGASSGVGLMGLQIARAKGAKFVIGTSTNAERRARLPEFGANLVLDSQDKDWVAKVLEATDGAGVDITIDMLSGNAINKNMEATAIHGHIINIGRLAGMSGEFNFDLHAKRRLHYIGTTGRTRSIEEAVKVAQLANADLWDLVVQGKIKPPIDKTFALDDAAEALDRMNKNKHFGKIVLLPDDR
ncbi:MAG: zinc-binding dehydrogenase [Methyloligellaceae bacterium]